MNSCISRFVVALILGLVISLFCLQADAAERSWVKVRSGDEIPPAMSKNLDDCLDTVADLLNQYHIYLS